MEQCLAIEMPASPLQARLLQKAGWFARGHGEYQKADRLLQRALEMAKGIGDVNRASWALMDLGLSARDQGNNEQAISFFSEAFLLARESGEARATGACMYFLAESYKDDLEKSRSFWEQGLNVFRGEADKTHIAWGLEGLAGVAYLERDFARAFELHLESLSIKAEVMDKLGIAHSLEGLAQVAAQEEEPERAITLWAAASHLRELMGTPPDPSREDLYISLIPRTRQQVGEALFEAAWKKGEEMKLEEAIEYALEGGG
jgi:non-specific serine/threonine protein kinase